ncbi:MAG: smc 5 [Gemmataceae bacterium]|nr:smc 5 [Gemmataceae bacterium]
MLKKLILVAVVGGLAVAAFKGTRWASYVRSEIRSMKEAAEDSVPPEKEIARLRGEMKMLDEDTLKVVKQLARLQSDQADLVKREKTLDEKKTTASELLRARETAVRAAEEKAKTGETSVTVSFGDQRLSLAVGKARLKETVRDYTDLDKEIGRTRAKIDSQQRIIDKLEKQRLEMTRLKTDLDQTIDSLEEEYQAIKLQQMECKYQTDDTRLAQIKESIAKLSKRFDVDRRTLNMLQETGTPPAGKVESVDEIMAPVTGAKAGTTTPTPTVPKSAD